MTATLNSSPIAFPYLSPCLLNLVASGERMRKPLGEEEEEEEKEKEEAALSDIRYKQHFSSISLYNSKPKFLLLLLIPSLSEEASSPTESKSLEKKLSEELEDILYLRLIALRSMNIPGDLSPESSSKSIEDEMTELLEEADQAATEAIPPPPIIDIADSEEEKMDFYMKTMTTNLSFMSPIKVKEEMEEDFNLLLNDVPQEEKEGPFYSPHRSPPDDETKSAAPKTRQKKVFQGPKGGELALGEDTSDSTIQLKPPLPLVKKAPPKKRLRKRKSQRVASSSDEEELARKSNKTKSTLRMPKAMRAHLLSSIAAKREEKQKRKKKRILRFQQHNHHWWQLLLFHPSLLLYFPNMVRPFIVPLNIPTSSEDEDTGGGGDAFQANLNLFMKKCKTGNPAQEDTSAQARADASPRSKHTDSIIEHLPLERQKEYKMLLARIANKEKKKKIQKSNAGDPEEMRRLLLSKMKSLKSKIEQNKSNLQKTMTVSSTQESSKENNVPDKRLPSAERDVISSRGELSAQLSQFRSESEKLLTAQTSSEEGRTDSHPTARRQTQPHLHEFHCSPWRRRLHPTETGAQQIKNKLTQIASNAKLCKKVNLSSSSSNGNNKEISGLSSSIDHLRAQSVDWTHTRSSVASNSWESATMTPAPTNTTTTNNTNIHHPPLPEREAATTTTTTTRGG
ncbi:Uncharacterized protein FKW44_001888, partial [Caligus rogercresseyi]